MIVDFDGLLTTRRRQPTNDGSVLTSSEPSFVDKVSKSFITVSLGDKDDFQIIKNRFGNTNHLDRGEAINLIRNILRHTVIGNIPVHTFFQGSISQEIEDSCKEIFDKFGLEKERKTHQHDINPFKED